ncbi:N-acetylornithine carbamoyltransferase [Aequorivita sp. Q41]|uniref:N-acetylornithine carbamoyltransferase n=1 Tax=Aequorivita sp. Q41 TaxID=3153300 RepID=UPI0032426269
MKNFISLNDVNYLDQLKNLALHVKQNPFAYKKYGKNKTLGLLFFNPSLRTRLSTQKAAFNIGMNVMVMNIDKDGWALEMEDGTVMNQGKQEHIKEAAAVISQYCDVIGVRTFAGLTNKEEDYSETFLNKFMKHSLVPVVSLESATLHPLQSFADYLTIEEHKKTNKPKVVLTWAPHPKALPQAVPNSFAQWMRATDYEFVIANPKGFDLSEKFTENVTVYHNQDEALKNADFVYAKNWSAYDTYGKTTAQFKHWKITSEKMQLSNQAKFMHCLPIRRNVVVADSVLDGDSSLVIQQANNRTFAAQTVLLKLLGYEN